MMEQTGFAFAWPPPEERADTGNRAALKTDNSSCDHTRDASEKQSAKRLKPGTKAYTLLALYLQRGDAGMNCFESARLGHDYVARTSISNYQRQYGLTFNRRWEQVPGHGGSKVECVRYWLAPESRERARELLGIEAPHE